jgi:hypothetical protein
VIRLLLLNAVLMGLTAAALPGVAAAFYTGAAFLATALVIGFFAVAIESVGRELMVVALEQGRRILGGVAPGRCG